MEKKITYGLYTIMILISACIFMDFALSPKVTNEKGKQLQCKENIEQSFVGTLSGIEIYTYDSFMHKNFFSIHIKTVDTTLLYVDYQFKLKQNKEILDFVKIGFQVYKFNGKNTFTIYDNNGKFKIFNIPYCD